MSGASPSLCLTVGSKPQLGDDERARAIAAKYGLSFVERGHKKSLDALIAGHDGVFVAARNGLTLWSKEGKLRWAEGMAHLRIERIDAGVGGDDQFLRHAELKPGESILDCTLGLAQDALVAARAVGPLGRVVGIEKSLALYVLTSEGLARHELGDKSARVECVHSDAAAQLASTDDKSFDVVFFDPMHERPGRAQPSFEGLRSWADYGELTAEMIDQARRVARRLVLVKGSRYSQDLKKLGLTAEKPSHSSTVIWAKVPSAS